jgi:hypothetical protein
VSPLVGTLVQAGTASTAATGPGVRYRLANPAADALTISFELP